MGEQIILYALMAASVVYQVTEARKAKRKQQEAADASKGQEVPVEGQSIALPVQYGRGVLGGARVYHNTTSNHVHAEPAPGGSVFQSRMGQGIGGSKNEFLYIQQALAHGPINRVVGWRVEDQDSSTPELEYGQRIHAYPSGNVADPMVTANCPERSSAVFTDTAYVSAAFRLNRDDPQYSGVPSLSLYVEGKTVRTVLAGSYALGGYVYSNNPAYCLLDYLLSPRYGRGLSPDDIDLKSFHDAAQVCDAVVQTNVKAEGPYWSSVNLQSRDLPLYECNLLVDTERPVRENVIDILSTMGDADLVWSSGKYKLQLQYPASLGEIRLAGTLGDDDIVRDVMSIKYPNASDRINHCTVKFRDEAQGFKEGTASWPKKGSAVHAELLAQDNGVPLENSFTEAGITDYYHATAKAEELVRVSRSSVEYRFRVNLKSTFYEPGDIVFVDTSLGALKQEYLKILEIKVDSTAVAEITAVKFDPAQLAWNAKDDQVIPQRNNYAFVLDTPRNLRFSANPADSLTGGLGRLTWEMADGPEPSSYLIEYKLRDSDTYVTLGTSSAKTVEIFSLVSGVYDFAVRARTMFGQMTARGHLDGVVVSDGTDTPPTFTIDDEIVLTAGKVTTNLRVTMLLPEIRGFLAGYEVEAKLQTSTTWRSLGEAASSTFELPNVIDGVNYDVRARVVNRIGNCSDYRVGSHNVRGKLNPPSNVSGFTHRLEADGILLEWSRISDLDADVYEIREGVSWEDGVVVTVTKDNRFKVQRPKAALLNFFVKARDTSGIYSMQESFLSVDVATPGAPAVSGSVVGSEYVLSWTTPVGALEISGYVVESDGVRLASVSANQHSASAKWVGDRTFIVKAVDVSGNVGSNGVSVVSILPPPATVVGSQVVDNNVLLRWSPVKGTLPLLGYEIRKGATWASGEVIGLLYSEFAVVFESFSGTYTYWVSAKDVAENYGAPAAVTTLVSQPPDFVLAVDRDSTFDGLRSNVVPDAAVGILLPFNPLRTWDGQFSNEGWSDFQSAIADGYTQYIQPSLSTGYYQETYDCGTTLTAMKVSVVPTIDSTGAPVLTTDIWLSEDGVDYVAYLGADSVFGSSFRYVRFRVTVTTASDSDFVHISRLKLILSAKFKSDTGSSSVYASDTEGTTVTLREPFLDISSISVTPKGSVAAIAIYDFVDVPNPTQFKVYLFNTSGQRIDGDVSWLVQGY